MTRPPDPNEARAIVGREIRRWRLQRHLSQAGLARAAGIDQASISNYEAGKRDLRVSTMIRIANALSIGVEDLLDRETQRSVLESFK
jgi:transcriptional regulator with XRE-family HTH domain